MSLALLCEAGTGRFFEGPHLTRYSLCCFLREWGWGWELGTNEALSFFVFHGVSSTNMVLKFLSCWWILVFSTGVLLIVGQSVKHLFDFFTALERSQNL